MAIHLHTEAPTSRPMTQKERYNACWRGEEPAEVLPVAERELLIYELWTQKWNAVQIASHLRMSTYTTTRIMTRLGLTTRPAREGAAA